MNAFWDEPTERQKPIGTPTSRSTHSIRTLGMSYGRSRRPAIDVLSTWPEGTAPRWRRSPPPTARVNHAVGLPPASSAARNTLYVLGR